MKKSESNKSESNKLSSEKDSAGPVRQHHSLATGKGLTPAPQGAPSTGTKNRY